MEEKAILWDGPYPAGSDTSLVSDRIKLIVGPLVISAGEFLLCRKKTTHILVASISSIDSTRENSQLVAAFPNILAYTLLPAFSS